MAWETPPAEGGFSVRNTPNFDHPVAMAPPLLLELSHVVATIAADVR